jgi:predicted RNA-binding protein with PUA-like domain
VNALSAVNALNDVSTVTPATSTAPGFWLMKAEPDDVSIDDLAQRPGQTVPWYGVRNYQARNFMRDGMRLGDLLFYYHSACEVPGIAGVARVSKLAYPDASQFDPASPYFDAKSDPANPRWLNVDVQLVERWQPLPLSWLRAQPELANFRLVQRGNRLSVMPVDAEHWAWIDSQKVLSG